MKNSFKLILIILFKLIFLFPVLANEQFNFDVTEIEILEKGNKVKGLNRGRVTTNDGIILDADTFVYDKVLNTIFAEGNVLIQDLINKVTIESNDITYQKNDENIFTNSRSKAISKNITIDANSFNYNKNLNTLNAYGDVKVDDKNKNIL